MPILAFAPGPVQLEIAGGTDVKWSPPIDYLCLVTLPILEKIGYHGHLETVRRGHYPKGGGLVKFSSRGPSKLHAMNHEKHGIISEVYGISHAVALPRHVAERQAAAAGKSLEETRDQVAAETLPREIAYDWADMSYQERQASGAAAPIFGLSFLFVFLVLFVVALVLGRGSGPAV